MPTVVKLSWPTASGPFDLPPITQGASESLLSFRLKVSKVAKAAMQANPPTGCVEMRWCASGTPKTEQVCPNAGESTADFIERAAAWIVSMLTDFPPTGDCSPPFP
jgi:hypothetical protein